MSSKGYRDLDVWQKAIAVVTDIYGITKTFPKEELYTLTSQIRRAAISIPSDIAEGKSRHGTKDFIRFLLIAKGSASELETQLIISKNLRYLEGENMKVVLEKVEEVGRMLSGLISKLTSSTVSIAAANN